MNSDAAAYLLSARNMPLLDREQEAELLRRIRAHGDRRAADTIARAQQRSVVALALKFRHYGVSLGDLIAEGNMGLLRALEKFELERGVRFGTYAAYWIRAQMVAHVIKSRSGVGGTGGAFRSQMFFKVRRERARVASELGSGDAADQVLADRLGISFERVQSMLQRLDQRDVSIEGTLTDHGRPLIDRLEADSNQEEELVKRQFEHGLEGAIGQALTRLDPRELFIARHRLMACDSEALALAEIARRFDISRERARQLEARAAAKLRRAIKESKSPVLDEWLRSRARARHEPSPAAA